MLIFCLTVSVAAALTYLAGLRRLPIGPTRSAIKTIGVGALAVAAIWASAPPLLVAGLALGAIGDFFLSRQGQGAFLTGLIAFALSHVAYVTLFWMTGAAPTGFAVFIVALIACAAMAILVPRAGALAIPVAIYITIIGAMGALAVGLPAQFGMATVAAILFMASDAVLGLELFVLNGRHKRMTGPFVWVTYYTAQLLFCGVFAQLVLR